MKVLSLPGLYLQKITTKEPDDDQLEVAIASINAVLDDGEIFGEEKYLEQYESLKKYAFSHFEDKEHGEWYGYLHYDGTVSHTLKGNIFKGPFHLPRMLILIDKIENNIYLF